jgi:hypothetical protein
MVSARVLPSMCNYNSSEARRSTAPVIRGIVFKLIELVSIFCLPRDLALFYGL